jgi:hypothetical protein
MIQEKSHRLVAIIASGLMLSIPGNAFAQTAPPAAQKQVATQSAKKKTTTAAKLAAPPTFELESKAVDILKTTSARLAGAHSATFTAIETFETLSRQGVPLVYANKSEVVLQRPNKLRVIQLGDGPSSEFYYDGKLMMAYAPQENLVAIADAPATIDATLESIYHSAGIYFPFTDLIVADPYGDLAPTLKHVYYVGQSKVVGGTTTDIIAIAGDGVFMQVWIGTDDKLPRAIHAFYLNDPDWLRHNLLLSDWQIDTPVSDDAFTSTKAGSAKKIPFAHPHPEPPPGAKPPVKSPAAKKPPLSSTPPKSN